MLDILSEIMDRDRGDILMIAIQSPVLTRGIRDIMVQSRLLDQDAGQEEAQAGADIVEHLTDAGGGDPLPRGEPGSGHGGRGRGDHDAGDPVEDGAQVIQHRQPRVRDAWEHEEHAANSSA